MSDDRTIKQVICLGLAYAAGRRTAEKKFFGGIFDNGEKSLSNKNNDNQLI